MVAAPAWPRLQDLDEELFGEYVHALNDYAPQIERHVGRLRASPDETEPLTVLFRLFHNLKGDASICRFDLGVQLAHSLESLLMRLRDRELRFTPMLGEAVLLAFDRMELAVEAIVNNKPPASLRLQPLLDGLKVLAEVRPAETDSAAARLIERVSGFRPSTATSMAEPATAAGSPATSRGEDLAFFRSLALQFEQRSPLFQGRTGRILKLAQSVNESAGRPVDPEQLEAAVYMHDVGMMFLPEPVWLKPGTLSDEERELLHRHPGFGSGLLERMSGWTEATRIVIQHHEMPDGRGYPHRLKADQICPGAKLMAIVDAFEAVMLKQSHRGQGRSLLRAAAEINASEQQFAAEWIKSFNQVAHRMLSD